MKGSKGFQHIGERPVVILALGTWSALAIGLAVGILSSHENRAPYYVIQFIVAIVGTIGALGWFLSWKRWRATLITVAAIYFALFFLRFFGLFAVWKLEYFQIPEAVWQTIVAQWSLIVHFMAQGWVWSGISVLFYEWLMPIFQLIVFTALLWPLTPGSRGDAPQTTRA